MGVPALLRSAQGTDWMETASWFASRDGTPGKGDKEGQSPAPRLVAANGCSSNLRTAKIQYCNARKG